MFRPSWKCAACGGFVELKWMIALHGVKYKNKSRVGVGRATGVTQKPKPSRPLQKIDRLKKMETRSS
jgi:hypothetical protein